MMKKLLLISFVIFGINSAFSQEFPDRHNTSKENTWMSCTPTQNPNPDHGVSHWIMYDLGTTYALYASTIWNVNAYDYLDNGMQDLQIDYSLDGVNWKSWGRYYLDQSSGLSTYEGQAGPDFNGTVMRYLLITGTSNYGGNCYGISEFRAQSTPVTISDTKDLTELNVDIKASPNPFSESTTINIDGELNGDNNYYQLIDISGRIVRQNLITDKRFQISGIGLSEGLYNLKIFNEEGSKSIQITHTK